MNLEEKLAKLTLEEKVSLLTGKDFWKTVALPSIGLRTMVLSDGPSGVRGAKWDEREPSLSLPSASSFASSWDLELLDEGGKVMAAEAHRKGVDVVLGPTINLHRSPLGGRHFECFSEDPFLSGSLASSFIKGIQSQGIAGTLKHYVANDSETERYTLSVEVSEKTLREVYLKPFEMAVKDSNPWLVMSAYNAVNGTTMSENPLLDEPLKGEWGFDGVVVSDWTAVRTTVEAGNASTDLAMPGPHGPWGEALVAAVRSGAVSESAIDSKVMRLLKLAERVGAFGEVQRPAPLSTESLNAFARRAAISGSVLLKNSGILPLKNQRRIAVIGSHAISGREQGGGSATVIPAEVVSALQGLSSYANSERTVSFALGIEADKQLRKFDSGNSTNPVTNLGGLHVQAFDSNDNVVFGEERFGGHLVWMEEEWMRDVKRIEVSTVFTPDESGLYEIGVAYVGSGAMEIRGVQTHFSLSTRSGDFSEAVLNPPEYALPIELHAGEPIACKFTFDCDQRDFHAFACSVGFTSPTGTKEEEISKAVGLANESEVAIVFVGTTPAIECEGIDRTNLRLPEGQDDLVFAVARTSAKTIVVVNAGAPVEMPWRDEVDAILLVWFPGQQMGNSIADIIFGTEEPGGRMPTSWPANLSDAPVVDVHPKDGVLTYAEGSHIGYRAWLKVEKKPLYSFGFGLGYTKWSKSIVAIPSRINSSDDLTITVEVENIGGRKGSEVVQVYGHPSGYEAEKKLMAFAKVQLEPGKATRIDLTVPANCFQAWEAGWKSVKGEWTICLSENALENIESRELSID